MSSRVRVLSISHVHPAQITDLSSTLPHAGDHKLSFLDVVHIPKVPIQRLFFFDGPDLPPFPSILAALRSSLAPTLTVFSPLTGELAFCPSSGEVFIDCSLAVVSSGVRFVETEYSGGADDMHRMASDDEHDTKVFLQLIPDIDMRQLPTCVLTVQVTRPATAAGYGNGVGAMAVGVSILHVVADGQAIWQFIRACSEHRLDL